MSEIVNVRSSLIPSQKETGSVCGRAKRGGGDAAHSLEDWEARSRIGWDVDVRVAPVVHAIGFVRTFLVSGLAAGKGVVVEVAAGLEKVVGMVVGMVEAVVFLRTGRDSRVARMESLSEKVFVAAAQGNRKADTVEVYSPLHSFEAGFDSTLALSFLKIYNTIA